VSFIMSCSAIARKDTRYDRVDGGQSMVSFDVIGRVKNCLYTEMSNAVIESLPLCETEGFGRYGNHPPHSPTRKHGSES
jgi:hypothetical protein